MDKASESRLGKVHPVLADRVRQLVASTGKDIRVVQGLRTYKEQNDLYAKGRTKPGDRVTNARGGYSNHNFGLAVDLCPFKDGKPDWDDNKTFNEIGKAAHAVGLEWGGDWKSITDKPHVQLHGMTTEQCRALSANGSLTKVWAKMDQILAKEKAPAKTNIPVTANLPGPDSGLPEQPPTEITQTKEIETETGTNKVEVTSKNEQDVTQPATVDGVKPYNEIGLKDTLKNDAKGILPANVGFQTVSEMIQQSTGWPPWVAALITKLAVIVLVLSVAWVLYRVIAWLVHTWKENERVKLQAVINSDVTRKDLELK